MQEGHALKKHASVGDDTDGWLCVVNTEVISRCKQHVVKLQIPARQARHTLHRCTYTPSDSLVAQYCCWAKPTTVLEGTRSGCLVV